MNSLVKIFLHSITGTLISINMTFGMNKNEKQPIDSALAWHAVGVTFRESRDLIVANILRDNPLISGQELAKYRGLLPVSVLRAVLSELWRRRQPTLEIVAPLSLLMGKDCDAFSQRLAATVPEVLPKFLTLNVEEFDNEQLAIKTLKEISQKTEIPILFAKIDHQSVSGPMFGYNMLMKKCFQAAELAAEQKNHKNFILKLLPGYIQNLLNPTTPNKLSPKCMLCFSNFNGEDWMCERRSNMTRDAAWRWDLDGTLASFLEGIDNCSPHVIVILLHDKSMLYPSITRRGCSLSSIVRETLLFTHFDLKQTMYELAKRTTNFTLGQLAQLIDEAEFEAELENSTVQRPHIIAAYNRIQAQNARPKANTQFTTSEGIN